MGTGLVHTVKGTAANVSDVSQVPDLLHGEEDSLHGDAGYIGAEKRLDGHRPETHIARKRGTVRAMPEGPARERVRAAERHKTCGLRTLSHGRSGCDECQASLELGGIVGGNPAKRGADAGVIRHGLPVSDGGVAGGDPHAMFTG
ncbi:hypothetical protein D893_01124 [Thioalkalivibrio sp. ALE21]|nr:hypothetical protein D893_01124 [Thioalkalivibrio sp. ALE21]